MLIEDYQALFIHFDDANHEGHATGFNRNPAYLDSIEVDEAIGELMTSLLSRPQVGEEEWMLVVTTDHGGRGTDTVQGIQSIGASPIITGPGGASTLA